MAEKKKKKSKRESGDLITVKVRSAYALTKVGVVAAVIGGLIKASVLTETFPQPFDILGNVILFVAVLLIVIDIARGGLED